MPHFRAMDIDRFWGLIEQARANAGPAADQAVRDFEEPDDDADRDYWDFDDLTSRPCASDSTAAVTIDADTDPDDSDRNERPTKTTTTTMTTRTKTTRTRTT